MKQISIAVERFVGPVRGFRLFLKRFSGLVLNTQSRPGSSIGETQFM
jgi:hypothetical protein